MKIKYKESTIELNEIKTVKEVFAHEINSNPNIIIACKCNNTLVSLKHELDEDTTVELLDITNKEGLRVYRRGLLYIMGKAIAEIYPEALITVQYQLSNALFCEVFNLEPNKENIDRIKKRMQEIINDNLPIKKVKMQKDEAKTFYEVTGSNKGKLQMYAKEKEYVSLYYCGDYYNYFYGVMPVSTGYMKIFDIEPYRNGFLIRYPNMSNPSKIGDYVEQPKLLSALDDYKNLHKTLNVHTLHKLNKIVEEGYTKGMILVDEALHEKKIAEIANDIVKKEHIKMVLIAGPSSSGKTTFAQRLGLQLKANGLKPVTISVDNYFVEREDTPKDDDGNYDFECIEAIDLKLFNDNISRLLKGETVEVPTFDFKEGTKIFNGKTMKLNDDEVLVIEGIHCLNDKLTNSIPKDQKYKIYISALTVLNVDYFNRISTTDSRLIRRIVRDYQFRGYSALHTLKMWDSVRRGEEKYIFPFQEEADSIFNSSLIYELGVLKQYALPLLEEIDIKEPEYSEARRLHDFLKYFESIPDEDVPKTSILREFVGGGAFEY